MAVKRYFAISVQAVAGDGRVGKGVAFSGTDSSYISLPPLNQRTVAAWIKPAATKSMAWFDGGGERRNQGFVIGFAHPERALGQLGDCAFLGFMSTSVMAPSPKIFEAWHHVAVAWDGERSVRICIDGAQPEAFAVQLGPNGRPQPGTRPAPAAQPVTLPEKPAPSSDSTAIGRCKTAGNPLLSPFAGAIDEFAAWDRALTDDELKDLAAFAANGKSYVEAIGEKNEDK